MIAVRVAASTDYFELEEHGRQGGGGGIEELIARGAPIRGRVGSSRHWSGLSVAVLRR